MANGQSIINIEWNDKSIPYPIRNGSHRRIACWHYGKRRHCPPTWGIVQLSPLHWKKFPNLKKKKIGAKISNLFTVFCDDRLRMGTSVAMDVVHSFVQSLDHFDGALEASVFGAQRFGRRRTKCQVFTQRRTSVNLHLHQCQKSKSFRQSLKITRLCVNVFTPSFLSIVHTSEKNVPQFDPFPPLLPSRSSWISRVSMALQADG